MIWRHIRTVILGPPLPSAEAGERRLDKLRALAVLSPDALASVAYANQEIFLGLVVAGSAGLAYSWDIALVIAGLLAILALSYSQTIAAYPTGGGSYTVARENLGTLPGLVAAAALMIDYVLNAAVSLTAGVEAVASAFPVLWPYRTVLALALLLVITMVNLRGLQEAGTAMIVPVYLFLATSGDDRLWSAHSFCRQSSITGGHRPSAVNTCYLFPAAADFRRRGDCPHRR